jgi:hypothetical protein
MWTIVCMDCTLSLLGLKPMSHMRRGHNWSGSQCYRALLPPLGSSHTVNMTVSLSFMVQKLVHCPHEGVQQASHIHPKTILKDKSYSYTLMVLLKFNLLSYNFTTVLEFFRLSWWFSTYVCTSIFKKTYNC